MVLVRHESEDMVRGVCHLVKVAAADEVADVRTRSWRSMDAELKGWCLREIAA